MVKAQSLGAYLRHLREQRERELRRAGVLGKHERLSQERVAREIPCALATYHRYERDKMRGLDVLAKIAAYYGVALGTLEQLPGGNGG